MVTTRAKAKSEDHGSAEATSSEPQTGQKRSRAQAPQTKATQPKEKQHKKEPAQSEQKPVVKNQEGKSDHGEDDDKGAPSKSETSTQQKPKPKPKQNQKKSSNKKVDRLIQQYANLPLSDTDLENPGNPTADTVLALLLHAILSSTRVSHAIAGKTTSLVIKAGYHNLDVLKKSTWEERTEVLTEGGYTHYREKTATFLGELAELVEGKYDGDLNAIPKTASQDPKKIRAELKTIKGLGDVGIDIFFTTAQHVWPCLAPWIDPRSLTTAEKIGLGNDVQALWNDVGEDPEAMCKLACALMDVRLEKRESEWT
ncbi:hypothetical protein A1O7_07522 [Cladophialophora yegresii CBS 114405]|uniref:HhH-GPD domain-containing protein n=1 Tax=Cladophialophora yegresii CBS 114405 TaxID=1182544 RepID=W9VWU6_9EURO|nr:uncharacterized protein A1O7_07522 [Cladophialophora yegresii CBS 114405]EXJ57175.1 hypothetical protein A1O7_07522 [Cladophialophora yegresii CBS 114405]